MFTVFQSVSSKESHLKGVKAMLMRFEVENFRSFKTKTIFDLSDTKNYEFNSECVQSGLVSKGIIYGRNGCGKSNLGLAVFDLISHLTDKLFPINFQSHYLHAELQHETAKFKYVFKFDDSIVEYSYEKKALRDIASEHLQINGVEVVTYNAGAPLSTTLKGAESLKTDLTDSKISALKYIKSNAVLNNDDETNIVLQRFFAFLDDMLFFRSVEFQQAEYIGYETGVTNIYADIVDKNHVSELQQLLNEAGISCELKAIETNGIKSIGFVFDNTTINMWEIASTGTKTLILFYYWAQRLVSRGASLLFIDEFDASYHHELAALIVQQLKRIGTQVILTTHDTSLMTNDLMRPDCCFLMENNKITPFSSLTAKDLRFAHNIEKMYKAGAFNV
jgi:AAA15 family ATPase/GTPase